MAGVYENLTEVISLRLSLRMLEALTEHSRRAGMPMTRLIRSLLDEDLEELDRKLAQQELRRTK